MPLLVLKVVIRARRDGRRQLLNFSKISREAISGHAADMYLVKMPFAVVLKVGLMVLWIVSTIAIFKIWRYFAIFSHRASHSSITPNFTFSFGTLAKYARAVHDATTIRVRHGSFWYAFLLYYTHCFTLFDAVESTFVCALCQCRFHLLYIYISASRQPGPRRRLCQPRS